MKEALSGYDSWFSYPKADPRELPFGIGLAIFSKTPLIEKSRIDVPSPAIEFEFGGKKTTPTDRLMIGAKTVINGREVQFYNVHLLAFFMLGSSSTMFPWQRDLVADRLASSDIPTILGGDFNVSQHASLVEQFAEFGYATVQYKVPTWHRRPFVLDHIFYNSGLKCAEHSVENSTASDHLPVVRRLRLYGIEPAGRQALPRTDRPSRPRGPPRAGPSRRRSACGSFPPRPRRSPEGQLELLLQEDLPLRDLSAVDAVDLGQPGALLRGQRLRGSGVRLGQALHREFVGAFHGWGRIAPAGA